MTKKKFPEMNSVAKNASPSFLKIKKIDVFLRPLKNKNQKSGSVIPSGLIQSLFSTKNLLPEMYSVAKNTSTESPLGEAFLPAPLIFENKFFAIQRV